MKYLFFTITLLVCVCSCKKQTQNPTGLIGKWELHSVDNFAYQVYPAGNGNILEFKSDSLFFTRPNYSDIHIAYRNISKSVCNLTNADVTQIFDTINRVWKDNFITALKGDTLTLLPVCVGPDNYGSVYFRIH